MTEKKQPIIKAGISNKDILTDKDNIDKIYVEVNVTFADNHTDMGPNLVLPRGETIEALNSPRILIFATLLEKMHNSALIAVAIFEKVGDDQCKEIDMVDVTIEGLSSSIKSVSADYHDFKVMMIASFDELNETKLCYDPNCLKDH